MLGSKIKIGLVEINNTFSGQHYLPYSIGCLVTYAKKYLKNPNDFEFLTPIYCRVPVEEAVGKFLNVDAVFFSTYVWNVRLSLKIAEELKRQRPEILTVFGGPHVPDRSEEFLRKNRFVDIACHNEGEQVFVSLLENLNDKNLKEVPGTSFISSDNRFVQNQKPPRIKDLKECSSPYLEGYFEPLVGESGGSQWMTVWETNRGCPFSCTFCDWGSATQSRVFQFPMERIYQEIDWFAKKQIDFIFCADANFGILPRDIEIASYFAETKKKYGYPKALQVLGTKNATERAYQVQKILLDAGLNKGVTVSFQSLDETTLKNIKRDNISLKTYHELQRRFQQQKIGTYTDLILGLPGETYDTFVEGVSKVIESGQHDRIQFNNLSLLPNAEMGDPEYQKKHGMVLIETNIVSMHGSFDEMANEVWERQILSVGTNTMPKEDWVKARAFAWMVSLLHFDKVLQIPLVLLHEICFIDYRELFDLFLLKEPKEELPILTEVSSFFISKAKDIQNGGSENYHSEEWLNIWWPEDEYVLIKLSCEEKLESFYQECETLIHAFLKERFLELPRAVVHDAIELNKNLLKQPFQKYDLRLELSYNIWEYYRSVLQGETIPLEQKASVYHVDRTSCTYSSWDDWCREVVWYGNKKGAYLYDGNFKIESQPAGHY